MERKAIIERVTAANKRLKIELAAVKAASMFNKAEAAEAALSTATTLIDDLVELAVNHGQ